MRLKLAPTILALSDLHLTDNKADDYRHQFMRELIDIVAQRKPQAVAILGDLTEAKDNHSARLVNRIVGYMHALAATAPVVVMMGNHDYHNEGHAFFEFLHRIPNLAWVGSVMTGDKLPKPMRGPFHDCLFLPHTRNHERDWHGVTLNNDYRYIFAHNTFNGAGVGFGRQLEGIPLDVFAKRARVIAGDIHVPQTLGPVTYIGAPYTVDYGDDYTPRMLALGRDVVSIGLGSFPQKRLLEVADIDELADCKYKAGDILKVRIHVEDMTHWHEIRDKAIKCVTQKGGLPQQVLPVINKQTSRRRIKKAQGGSKSDIDIIEQFAKTNSLPERTLRMGVKIMGEVK